MKPAARSPRPPPPKKLSKNPADAGDGATNIQPDTNPADSMSTRLRNFAVINSSIVEPATDDLSLVAASKMPASSAVLTAWDY
jgi:hypothetical protein